MLLNITKELMVKTVLIWQIRTKGELCCVKLCVFIAERILHHIFAERNFR